MLRERVSKAGQGFNTFNDAKISGYYNTKSFDFTGGLSVRDWLAGQSYQTQYDFGMNALNKFEVIN